MFVNIISKIPTFVLITIDLKSANPNFRGFRNEAFNFQAKEQNEAFKKKAAHNTYKAGAKG